MPETHPAETFSEDRIGPRRARAWFDTVLNPLIGGLRQEAELVKSGDLTWRMPTRTFAALVPARDQIRSVERDNLDEFVSFYPNVGEMISTHDAALQCLLAVVRRYYDELVDHPQLKELADKLWPHKLEDPPELDLSDRYAAEYIINNVVTLPAYYQMSSMWNEYSGEFLRLRHLPDLEEAWQEVDLSCKTYLDSLEELAAELTAIRRRLADRLDVPLVERVAS